jgi:hypothetical protein
MTLALLNLLWSNCAEAETLYQVDELDQVRNQGVHYFNAVNRLAAIEQEGAQRIREAIGRVRQANGNSERYYWRMDYILQRAWLIKATAVECIELLHRQEQAIDRYQLSVANRRLFVRSDFYGGVTAMMRMQRVLHESKRETSLQDSLLSATLLSMATINSSHLSRQWMQQRDQILNKLRAMRSELNYLAANMEKIGPN